MPKQDLDRAQISSGFEQVSREAMAQGVRMDVLMLEAGAERGLLARSPQHLGGDRTARRMPPVAGKQPLGGLVPKPAPVAAQRFEQRRTQHHVPVLAPLAAADMNHHPLAVDVGYLQPRHFRPSYSRGIERHEQDALKRRLGGIDQTRDLLLAEDLWKVQDLLRVRR